MATRATRLASAMNPVGLHCSSDLADNKAALQADNPALFGILLMRIHRALALYSRMLAFGDPLYFIPVHRHWPVRLVIH